MGISTPSDWGHCRVPKAQRINISPKQQIIRHKQEPRMGSVPAEPNALAALWKLAPCLNSSRHDALTSTSIGLAFAHLAVQSPSIPFTLCVICLLSLVKGTLLTNSYRVSKLGNSANALITSRQTASARTAALQSAGCRRGNVLAADRVASVCQSPFPAVGTKSARYQRNQTD